MISVPYPKMHPEGMVLDLCVRKNEKCQSPKYNDYSRYSDQMELSNSENYHHYLSIEQSPRLMKPILSQDSQYSATVAVLQQRLCEDKLTPPHEKYGSDHSGSIRSDSPTSSLGNVGLVSTPCNRGGKPTRPFKAYPKDPLTLINTVNEGYSDDSGELYAEFRRRMLEQVHAASGGNTGNKNMRRPVQSLSPTNQMPSSSMDCKDSTYRERRRKNNEAAKRSRDARRAKEDELAIRAAFLEQENAKLKYEIISLRNETNRLRYMLFPN